MKGYQMLILHCEKCNYEDENNKFPIDKVKLCRVCPKCNSNKLEEK